MSKFGITVGGKNIIRPGWYSEVNDGAMVPRRGNPARGMIIVDVARGGPVGGAVRIRSAQDVTNILVGGSGAQLAQTALKRGADVTFIRVNKATPAKADLGDVELTAIGAGTQGRALQYRRTVNPHRTDAFDLTLADSRTNRKEPFTAIGPVLDVRYKGVGNTPTVTVDVQKEQGQATVQLAATGGADGENVTYTSENVSTLQALADAINNTGAWSARIVGNLSGSEAELTELQAGSITPADVSELMTLKLGPTAIVRALASSELATAELKDTPTTPKLTNEFVYFDGGSEGPVPTIQDWADALRIADKTPAYGVVIGTGDPAVVGMAILNVEMMSNVKNRKERVLFAGPSLTGTKATLKENALKLADGMASERMVVFADQGRDYDVVTGKKIRVSAATFAADACAVYCTGRPEKNLTATPCIVPEREFEWEDDEVEEFLRRGVVSVSTDPDDGIAKYEQGITTYTRDANVMRRKISGVGIKDYLSQKMRMRLKPFTGEVGDETTVSQIHGVAASVLDEETRGSSNPEGVITAGQDPDTGAEKPAWENLEVIMDGFDLVAVEYDAHPVGEIAYGRIRSNFSPVTIRAN